VARKKDSFYRLKANGQQEKKKFTLLEYSNANCLSKLSLLPFSYCARDLLKIRCNVKAKIKCLLKKDAELRKMILEKMKKKFAGIKSKM